jgi:SAM-dependent methyltransferase
MKVGAALLQTDAEWTARTDILASSLSDLVNTFVRESPQAGLDIGCQTGALTDRLTTTTQFRWRGIDPIISSVRRTDSGNEIGPGQSDDIPFPDQSFDAIMLANVFEHIPPSTRQASFDEMHRVLRPGSVLVGQIPNPYFPIESHSRLPFMGCLPFGLQKRYWKLAPVDWDHDFWSVTPKHLVLHAEAAGFKVELVKKFNYPKEAIPKKLRLFAQLATPAMKVWPWSWQFVLTS